jgi:glycosyltransferase involved in cell wall biosynthesis
MNHIVAVSDKLQNKLLERSPWIKDKLVTIYDIVNQDVIRLMSDEPVQDMLRQDGVVSIVTTGRLVPQKNYLLAVEAARILKNNNINFKWFFVGEGSDRNKIERRISDLDLVDDVKLLGFKDNPYPYMANADIYVQTSSFEGFGLTVAEAKILHRPIVSTNFDVVCDQIIDYQNGLIAEMTPESVANCIMELSCDKRLKDSIVENLGNEVNSTSVTEPAKFMRLIDS